jgi:methyltransferase
LALVALIALQRLAETRRSKRHQDALLQRGAQEFGAAHYPVMVVLHGSWLFACAAEAWWWVSEPPSWLWVVPALLGLVAGQTLRILAMQALGERWTTRVIVLPGEPLVTGGVFTVFRHPNYVGVVLEIAALPLVFGCWRTALFYTVANAFLLRHRRVIEEEALGG